MTDARHPGGVIMLNLRISVQKAMSFLLATLLLASISTPSVASGTTQTTASTSIQEAAGIRLVLSRPLQNLMTIVAVSAGVTFTDSGLAIMAMPDFVSDVETTALPGLGVVTGMNGEAVSVSVGRSNGGIPQEANTGASTNGIVVVAQYN